MKLIKYLIPVLSICLISATYGNNQEFIVEEMKTVQLGTKGDETSGVNHSHELLTIEKLSPQDSQHKCKIKLSNGTKYVIYPFHGWDLDHWKKGDSISIGSSNDLSYKIKITNLRTNESISVRRK